CQRLGSGPFPDPRKPLGFKRDLDVRKTRRKARETCENRGLANIEPDAVQHGEGSAKSGFPRLADGGTYAAWAAVCWRITSRKIAPYCLSLVSPTPCTAAISAIVLGLRRAMSRSVLSANTKYTPTTFILDGRQG